jgi:hypothetical protein
MTPEGAAALRILASAWPVGIPVPIPREWLLELLEDLPSAAVRSDPEPADLTVAEVAARYGRSPSTVRGWIVRGALTGVYKFQNREIRIPLAALATFEANQRTVETPRPAAPHRASRVDWTAYKRAS